MFHFVLQIFTNPDVPSETRYPIPVSGVVEYEYNVRKLVISFKADDTSRPIIVSDMYYRICHDPSKDIAVAFKTL